MSDLKAEKKELLKNVSWLFVAKSVPSAANFLEVIVLARVLGLDGFGLLTLVVAYVKIVSSVLDLRVWESVVRYVGEFVEKNEPDHALSMIKFSYIVDFLTGLVAFTVCVALAGIANEMFIKSPDGFELVLIFSFALMVATVNTTSEALFRVFDKFKTIVFLKLSGSVFKLGSVLAALYLGYGIRGVLFAYAAASFFDFVLSQAMVNRILKERGLGGWLSARVVILSGRIREITWFLLNTSFNATLKIANEGRVAVLVLGYFSGGDAAGLYRIARSVIKIITRITDPVYEAIFPKLVSLSTLNLYEKLAEIVKFSLSSLLKLAVPVLIVIFLVADQLIGLVFGGQYVPASNTMRVLAVAVLFTGSTFWVTPLLLSVGKPGLRTAVNMFRISAYFVLLLVLVPKYSYLGAGVSFLVAEFLNFLVALYLWSRFNRAYLK